MRHIFQLSDGVTSRESQLFAYCVEGITGNILISKNFQGLYIEKVVCVFQA